MSGLNILTLEKKGVFIHAYGDDALVLSNIMMYKCFIDEHKGCCKCSFPERSFAKVRIALKNAHVSFRFEGMNDEMIFEDNQYDKFNRSSDREVVRKYLGNLRHGYHPVTGVPVMQLNLIDDDMIDVFETIYETYVALDKR